MITAINKVHFKIETPWSIIINKINKVFLGKNQANKLKYVFNGNKLKTKYLHNSIWNFNGIKLPYYLKDNTGGLMYLVYLDSLFMYCNHNDNYDNKLVDQLDLLLPEGPYCYKNQIVDITIKPNNIVIDAGAWIGDFSAYASTKGAIVYAFEPSKENLRYLEITQRLNNNIHIIPEGLGNKSDLFYFSHANENSLIDQITENTQNAEQIKVTTIDEFVTKNNIPTIDFIKADIEGFERYMLMGAKETLRKFAPKLAICTYHLPDDPEILKNIILDANPKYVIVQKSKKLYAQVPCL